MNPTGIPDLPKQLRDQNTSNQEEKTETNIFRKLFFKTRSPGYPGPPFSTKLGGHESYRYPGPPWTAQGPKYKQPGAQGLVHLEGIPRKFLGIS